MHMYTRAWLSVLTFASQRKIGRNVSWTAQGSCLVDRRSTAVDATHR